MCEKRIRAVQRAKKERASLWRRGVGALAAIHTVGAVGASHIERAVASVVTLAVACNRACGQASEHAAASVPSRAGGGGTGLGGGGGLRCSPRVKPSGLARGARAKRMDMERQEGATQSEVIKEPDAVTQGFRLYNNSTWFVELPHLF